MAISVAGVGKHILANLVFQFTLGWVLLLLYSLPSFCGDMSLFDIKHYSGFLGYQICLVAACGLGAMAAARTCIWAGAGTPWNPADSLHKSRFSLADSGRV